MVDDNNPSRRDTSPEVRHLFRQLLDEHKHAIRLIVLEELIAECYGPQPLLDGRRINDLSDFREWLEKKLAVEKEKTI
jgi:hypothetical protein